MKHFNPLNVLLILVLSATYSAATKATLIDFDRLGDLHGLFKTNNILCDDPSTNAKLTNYNIFNTYTRQNESIESGEFAFNEGYLNLAVFHNDNWRVELDSASQTVPSLKNSFCKNVETKGKQDFNDGLPQGVRYTLGIRVLYPRNEYPASAFVRPPFEFEFYDGKKGDKYTDGRGVVKNVGVVKELTSWINGRNFKTSYTIRLKDREGKVRDYFMGYLYFRGWTKVKWENPNYLTKTRDRKLSRQPLYPRFLPALKFDSMHFQRPRAEEDLTDFVTYVKDVEIEYDLAEPAIWHENSDIDDEEVWHILKKRAYEKRMKEAERRRRYLELYMIEQSRMLEALFGTVAPSSPAPRKLGEDYVKKNPPTAVNASDNQDTMIRVSWSYAAVSGVKFEIYRSKSENGAYTKIGESASSPYEDNAAELGGVDNWYKVRAVLNSVSSPDSKPASGLTLQ